MELSLVTILVIDENIMVRSVLETLLEREGFSVLSTRSAGVGVLLLAAWILVVRATWVSLGLLGLVLAGVVIGVFVWWLMSVGIVSREGATMQWIGVVAVGIVLGIGMGWSLFRAKATGQVETD